MKLERKKNASRNIVFGMVLKVYQILGPFLMRTVMLYMLGFQYLGLNGLFTSILQVLNLAELGVGSAMVYNMYQPVIDDDREKICALMRLYRSYYRIIGLVIAVLGLLLLPILPHLIRMDTVPENINIYGLYLLNLAAVVMSYWLYAYKNSLLNAHQREDVISKVNLATSTIQYAVQLAVLVVLKNYYLYILTSLAVQSVTNIATAVIVGRMYPDYRAEGELKRAEVQSINRNIRDLFTSRVSMVIVYSSDSIVISAFLGLTVLAVYQNYYFIMSSVIGVVGVIFRACMAGIGNSLLVETKEKNTRDFQKVTFIICWIACVGSCCFLNLYQPFMCLWTGEERLLPFGVVLCLVIYFYVQEVNQMINMYKDAAGIWRKDRLRPLVTALCNLGANLLLVRSWGLYGVILSTVLSLVLVGMPWLLHNLFTTILEEEQKNEFVRQLLTYCAVSAGICAVCCALCSRVQGSAGQLFFLRGILCAVLPNVLLWLVFRRNRQYRSCLELAKSMRKVVERREGVVVK